jgi:protein TonB
MKTFLTFTAILFALCLYGQQPQHKDTNPKSGANGMDKFVHFPGGDSAAFAYFAKNIVYPDSARIKGIQGTVYVSLTIDSTGNISQAKILKGVSPDIDKEALRAVSNMPAWQWNKTIKEKDRKCTMTLPIKFSLQ